jgi:folate-binding protein YgfZ
MTQTLKYIALSDCSSWGLIELKGSDRLRFLHNQTTSNIQALQPSQGCDTVFVNSTGRTLDLATAYVTEDSILVLVSPHQNEKLMAWMDRYLFPMDKVELKDLSGKIAIFRLIGSESLTLLKKLSLNIPENPPLHSHFLVNLGQVNIRIAVGTGLGLPGYTLLLPQENALDIGEMLHQAGAVVIDSQAWEKLRIQQGRPMPGAELTEDYNALEAGLWSAISFDKGCYIGQETIARLNTYKGVKQRLWGIKLDKFAPVGSPLIHDAEKVGILTSVVPIGTDSCLGLAYVRTKAGGEGLQVEVGETTGEIIPVPFLSHN